MSNQDTRMSSSALDAVEEAKAKQNTFRERLAARRQQRQNLLANMTSSTVVSTQIKFPFANISSSSSAGVLLGKKASVGASVKPNEKRSAPLDPDVIGSSSKSSRDEWKTEINSNKVESQVHKSAASDDSALRSDIESNLASSITVCSNESASSLDIRSSSNKSDDGSTSVEQTLQESVSESVNQTTSVHVSSSGFIQTEPSDGVKSDQPLPSTQTTLACGSISSTTACDIPTMDQLIPIAETTLETELEHLLGAQTTREKKDKRVREEIMELLNRPTTKERFLSERFRTQGGSQVQQFCAQGTRLECAKFKARNGDRERCRKLHFRKIIHPHTDESLGDCSFLNTCFHVDTCKYVHYTIDSSNDSVISASTTDTAAAVRRGGTGTGGEVANNGSAASITDGQQSKDTMHHETSVTLYPPQWINCDIRLLNMSILGKFAVIMADPPWDIHMELPYGTMSDDEMRLMDIPCLQDDGYIFLWVTGRAMELGRECLRLWGYQRVDEIIWVKTNQLQRLIRTGRTGHWLNHGKEHCLVGVKGKPQGINRGLDCDVIVSEVRETSHKPDEIYGIIERLSPGTRKLEMFGRPHNLQPNWITLGNQLDGTYLVDPAVVERFRKQYPNGLDVKQKSQS